MTLWHHGNRFGAERPSFLPPLKLTLHEAVTIFLSTPLMQRFRIIATTTSLKRSTSCPASPRGMTHAPGSSTLSPWAGRKGAKSVCDMRLPV